MSQYPSPSHLVGRAEPNSSAAHPANQPVASAPLGGGVSVPAAGGGTGGVGASMPNVPATFAAGSAATGGGGGYEVDRGVAAGQTVEPSAEFYQAAVSGAGIPVIALDPTGLILSWNTAAVRMFGRSASEVLGRALETLIPTDFRRQAGAAFQRTLQQRSTNIYELELIPHGGKHPIHVGVTLSCVIDATGNLQGVMAWMRDITNRKELEANLVRTRHMASIGTLAAGVAHHFNNIACSMGTMVDFALATEDPISMVKALRMSAEASGRISYITQSLLACSSGGGDGQGCGTTGSEPDMADLTEELLRFADAVEPTLNQKGIQLELDLKALRITAVPRIRFGQALQHLLKNAEDAIGERVRAYPGAQRKITLRTQSQGEQLMLQFSDTGAGILPENLPHVFDPFYTTKGVQNGGHQNNPGLGLTLVHSVVMDLSGHIWADSVVDAGTTINILVPIVV